MTKTIFSKMMKTLMNNAWTLVKVRNLSMADAMKMAWKVYYLKTKGHEGKVEFDYIKKQNGQLRHAVGTFKRPANTGEKKSGMTYTPLQIRYWDVEANGMRSCIIDNIVAVY